MSLLRGYICGAAAEIAPSLMHDGFSELTLLRWRYTPMVIFDEFVRLHPISQTLTTPSKCVFQRWF